MFVCNNIEFDNLNAAIAYCNAYFNENGVILGIEEI